MVKNLGGKKVWRKGCCKGLVKKILPNIDLHCQSSINSKTKLNKVIPNIKEHNKTNLRCTVESIIHGYHKYMSKLSLESKLDLLKYLYAKQIKTHLTLLCALHVTKTGKLAKNTLANWK